MSSSDYSAHAGFLPVRRAIKRPEMSRAACLRKQHPARAAALQPVRIGYRINAFFKERVERTAAHSRPFQLDLQIASGRLDDQRHGAQRKLYQRVDAGTSGVLHPEYS